MTSTQDQLSTWNGDDDEVRMKNEPRREKREKC